MNLLNFPGYHYAAYGCVDAAGETVGTATFISPPLAQLLRGGGYTIFFRHVSARLCGDRLDLDTRLTKGGHVRRLARPTSPQCASRRREWEE